MFPLLTSAAVLLALGAAATGPSAAIPVGTTAWSYAAGTLSLPLPGSPEDAAKAFVRLHAIELGLVPGADLTVERTVGTIFGPTVILGQSAQGIPVLHGEVAIGFDHQRRVARVSSGSQALVPMGSAPAIAREQAIDAASQGVPGALLDSQGRPQGATRLVYAFARGQLRLAYQVYVPALSLLRNDLAIVDALTGEVLGHVNRVYTSDDAQVFNPIPLPDGGGLSPTVVPDLPDGGRADGGFIVGERAYTMNCCPNAGCDPAQPARRADGGMTFAGRTITYDLAVCDRLPEATNERDAGSYLYPPLDPPGANDTTIDPAHPDPADYDPFAEPEAYTHALQQYDYFRSLSGDGGTPFTLKDNAAGRKLLVWTNVVEPKIDPFQVLLGNNIHSDTMQHVDNAAFVPRESWQQQPVNSAIYPMDSSALLFFQGDQADFSYDTSVTYHEFTHGMIDTNATFAGIAFYPHGANDEAGAMNEGFADFFAAAHLQDPKVGEYVGPRIQGLNEGQLRDLSGNLRCPDLIEGEVHQDSQHFSQSLWALRQQHLGSDQGHTFDAAVYAAIVGMTQPTFATMAEAVSQAVATAFQVSPGAVRQVFTDRGVLGCDDILDAGAASVSRDLYGIAGLGQMPAASATYVPGPIELHLRAPAGASHVQVSGSTGFDPSTLAGGSGPQVDVLASVGSPITFTYGATLTDDAQARASLTFTTTLTGQVSATGQVPVDCGDDVYVTLVNKGPNPVNMQNLQVSLTGSGCADAGPSSSPDAGTSGASTPDAGSPGSGSGVAHKKGCGCNEVDGSSLAMLLVGLLGFARRLRR